MIEAIIHNKIPSGLKNDEDCLTSTVWGLLKYRPMRSILYRFLSRAALYVNNKEKLGIRISESYFEKHQLEIIFWQSDPEFGQPDILIECGNLALVVEDKFNAPLSGDDQLRKYGDFLARSYPTHDRYIIYLTADWDLPADVQAKGYEASLYWLSWYELHSVATGCEADLEPVAREMATDLVQYLEHLGFFYFQGFSSPQIPGLPTRLFWDDVIPIISNYELQPMPRRYFWREEE